MDAAIRPPVKHSRHISTDEKLFSPLLTAFETALGAIFRPLIIMCGLVAQLYPPLCNPMECSPPGSSLPWGFPRHEYWSGLPFPSSGDLPDPGIQLRPPALTGGFFTSELPGKPRSFKEDTVSC